MNAVMTRLQEKVDALEKERDGLRARVEEISYIALALNNALNEAVEHVRGDNWEQTSRLAIAAFNQTFHQTQVQMSDIKISETARKAANATALHIVGELQMIPATEAYDFLVKELLSFRQLAINEACKPLVEALEQAKHPWPSSHHTERRIEEVLATHRKEHGQ